MHQPPLRGSPATDETNRFRYCRSWAKLSSPSSISGCPIEGKPSSLTMKRSGASRSVSRKPSTVGDCRWRSPVWILVCAHFLPAFYLFIYLRNQLGISIWAAKKEFPLFYLLFIIFSNFSFLVNFYEIILMKADDSKLVHHNWKTFPKVKIKIKIKTTTRFLR